MITRTAVSRPAPPVETHEVTNQVPPWTGRNLFETDTALAEAVEREGASTFREELAAFGHELGRPEIQELGFLANRYPPELRTHDPRGHRIDEVVFHPSYHELMRRGVEAGVHALAWRGERRGAHVARLAKHYLLTQVEAGVMCPLTMTFAVVPALRLEPEVAAEWEPRATSLAYEPGARPAAEKAGCLLGMAMTEKQGGSDVRSNTTRAQALGGGEYLLTGHKWFCSAPMNDAFLTLAQTEAGLTCFLVPRWLEGGKRNPFLIQRLKDKLGNRSNASAEVEYRDTWARRVGEEGRGVVTIIEMVNHTRLDCMSGSAGLMRQALVQAVHHTAYRSAFGRLLSAAPLMQNVLADLALDSEAATALVLRVGRTYEEAERDETLRPLRRLLTAVGKYYLTKRCPPYVAEALECLGGNGYVEESILPRIYREAPVNSVWEGSGNVICLDVLRALHRDESLIPALLDELRQARGGDRRYDRFLDQVETELADRDDVEVRARRLVEKLALALQGSVLVRQAPAAVADAFCATRLGGETGREYGTLSPRTDFQGILERALPVS